MQFFMHILKPFQVFFINSATLQMQRKFSHPDNSLKNVKANIQ